MSHQTSRILLHATRIRFHRAGQVGRVGGECCVLVPRALQLYLLPIAQYDLDEMDKHKLLVESLYPPPHVKTKVRYFCIWLRYPDYCILQKDIPALFVGNKFMPIYFKMRIVMPPPISDEIEVCLNCRAKHTVGGRRGGDGDVVDARRVGRVGDADLP